MRIRRALTENIFKSLQRPADDSDEIEGVVDVLESTDGSAALLLKKIELLFGKD